MALRFDILTTFPEMFADTPGCALNSSIPSRARAAGLVEWHATNIREFAGGKHAKTDDRPFGGGPGMVMMCQPVYDAVNAVEARDPRPATRILLTPQHAKRLMRALADNIKKFENQFGVIDENDQNVNFPPMNFNTPKAQA